MEAEYFSASMAAALKKTLEEIMGQEDPIAADCEGAAWLKLFAELPKAKRCECGSGSDAVGPAHSHWCQCHG